MPYIAGAFFTIVFIVTLISSSGQNHCKPETKISPHHYSRIKKVKKIKKQFKLNGVQIRNLEESHDKQ